MIVIVTELVLSNGEENILGLNERVYKENGEIYVEKRFVISCLHQILSGR
jgi:hypothetical protein